MGHIASQGTGSANHHLCLRGENKILRARSMVYGVLCTEYNYIHYEENDYMDHLQVYELEEPGDGLLGFECIHNCLSIWKEDQERKEVKNSMYRV